MPHIQILTVNWKNVTAGVVCRRLFLLAFNFCPPEYVSGYNIFGNTLKGVTFQDLADFKLQEKNSIQYVSDHASTFDCRVKVIPTISKTSYLELLKIDNDLKIYRISLKNPLVGLTHNSHKPSMLLTCLETPCSGQV